MAISNEKLEVFVREYLETNCASDAYRAAHPKQAARWKQKTIHNAAYKLMQMEKVKARLAEVRKELEEQLYFGVREAFKKYEEIYKLGKTPSGKDGNMQLSAAKGAVDSQARLFGLLIDKREDKPPAPADMQLTEQQERIMLRHLQRKYEESGGVDEE